MRFSTFFEYPNLDEFDEKPDDLTFLADLTDDEWAKVQAHSTPRTFKRGETLLREGDRDRGLYMISRGTLDIRVPRGGSRRGARVTTIHEGAVFGEQAFMDGKPRSANVVAVTDGEILVLTPEGFQQIVETHPKIASQILFDLGRILSLRLRQTTFLISKWVA